MGGPEAPKIKRDDQSTPNHGGGEGRRLPNTYGGGHRCASYFDVLLYIYWVVAREEPRVYCGEASNVL